MVTEEDIESTLTTIRENISRIKRLNQIITDGEVMIAGETFTLPANIKTVLTTKVQNLKDATRSELETLLV